MKYRIGALWAMAVMMTVCVGTSGVFSETGSNALNASQLKPIKTVKPVRPSLVTPVLPSSQTQEVPASNPSSPVLPIRKVPKLKEKPGYKLPPSLRPSSSTPDNKPGAGYTPSGNVHIDDPGIHFNDHPNDHSNNPPPSDQSMDVPGQSSPGLGSPIPPRLVPGTFPPVTGISPPVVDDSAAVPYQYFLNVQTMFGTVSLDPEPVDRAHPRYPRGTDVILTPYPHPQFRFQRWEGPCRPTVNREACKVVMDQDTSVRAFFVAADLRQITLTVTGRGRVVSEPAGLDCGDGHEQCSMMHRAVQPLVLRATASPHQEFNEWHVMGEPETCRNSRVEDGRSTCQVRTRRDEDMEVRAGFTNNAVLTVTIDPVSTSQGGISGRSSHDNNPMPCSSPGNCVLAASTRPDVTLTATPYNGGSFEGWKITDANRVETLDGRRNTLRVVLDHDKTVAAIFHSQAYLANQRLTAHGCSLDPHGNFEFTCDNMNGYSMCGQSFRDGVVGDCHASFNASIYPELNTVPAPVVQYTGRDAQIIVRHSRRGSRDGVRSTGYRILLQAPPDLPRLPESECSPHTHFGEPLCRRSCVREDDLHEDAETGSTLSLLRVSAACNSNLTGHLSPTDDDARRAYDMCMRHAASQGLNVWNFDLHTHIRQRIGGLYTFRNSTTPRANMPDNVVGVLPPVAVQDFILYKRSALVEAPMIIQCRE